MPSLRGWQQGRYAGCIAVPTASEAILEKYVRLITEGRSNEWGCWDKHRPWGAGERERPSILVSNCFGPSDRAYQCQCSAALTQPLAAMGHSESEGLQPEPPTHSIGWPATTETGCWAAAVTMSPLSLIGFAAVAEWDDLDSKEACPLHVTYHNYTLSLL